MDKTITRKEPETDILHFENQSKLSAAEIAKAVAHHNHHHPEKPQQDASTKPKTANKGR
jgi:dTDP-4-dehydrorhamnose reductase